MSMSTFWTLCVSIPEKKMREVNAQNDHPFASVHTYTYHSRAIFFIALPAGGLSPTHVDVRALGIVAYTYAYRHPSPRLWCILTLGRRYENKYVHFTLKRTTSGSFSLSLSPPVASVPPISVSTHLTSFHSQIPFPCTNFEAYHSSTNKMREVHV